MNKRILNAAAKSSKIVMDYSYEDDNLIGFRFSRSNTYHWFDTFLDSDYLSFNHSYNRSNGKIDKGIRWYLDIMRRVDKEVIKDSEFLIEGMKNYVQVNSENTFEATNVTIKDGIIYANLGNSNIRVHITIQEILYKYYKYFFGF